MAGTSSSLPNWALLDRRIYVRDEESFPANVSTMAASAITRGDKIRICFKFDEPPRPSRVFLCWPGRGPRDRFFFVAAHRDAVLFQVTYPINDFPHDVVEFFVYRIDSSSRGRPSLDLVPPIEGTLDEFKDLIDSRLLGVTQRVRRREGLSIAVLRRGQDFALGELEIPNDTAELQLFKSSGGGGGRWGTTRPKIISHSNSDIGNVQWYWQTDQSFAFGNYLCWVDYCIGGMFFYKVFDEDPVLEYLALPATLLDVDREFHGGLSRYYHSVGVDEEHGLLKFVMITRGDGKLVEHKLSEHDFPI